MTLAQVRRLKAGSTVRWNDPAAAEGPDCDCSRVLVVKSVRINDKGGDEIVYIESMDGGGIECFAHELSDRAIVPAVEPSRQESAGVCQATCRHEWQESAFAGYTHWCQRCLLPGKESPPR